MEYIYSFFNLHFSLTRQNEASVCVLVYITASYLNSLFYYSAKTIGVKFSLKFFFSILGMAANRDTKLPWFYQCMALLIPKMQTTALSGQQAREHCPQPCLTR